MASTTNFEEWFEQLHLEHEEVYELYNTVRNSEDTSYTFPIESINNGKGLLVKCIYNKTSLVLASKNANDAFFKAIEGYYCDSLDIDTWYGFHSALSNSKS